ncbi:type II toxin-antitoxin system VapC family toxin [Candidatus Poribacteria bacterium]|nr:type II toxin-antitoxin system VapC family toxin [Candidatus Poribacteria bacterium]
MEPKITVDTHSLVWFLDKSLQHRLSDKALNAIREAAATGVVYVPTIVLMETLDLVEKGRVNLSFDDLVINIGESQNYQIVSFDVEVLRLARPLKGFDIHDRLILATAVMTDSGLVSKDREILRKYGIHVIW